MFYAVDNVCNYSYWNNIFLQDKLCKAPPCFSYKALTTLYTSFNSYGIIYRNKHKRLLQAYVLAHSRRYNLNCVNGLFSLH